MTSGESRLRLTNIEDDETVFQAGCSLAVIVYNTNM
jgi:hypothetical protein